MKQLVKTMVAPLLLAVGVGVAFSGEVGELSLQDVQRQIKERGYSWTAGPTGVSDLSVAAKRGLAGLVVPADAGQLEASIPLILAPPNVELPERWDWRESVPGVHPVGVTPVKNQGTCGSCWAFAAAAQLESHMRIFDGVVEDVSEQQIVSCNFNGGSCGGGWHLNAYTVFMAPGAVTEICFPYENADAPCAHWDCPVTARIADYSRVANDIDSIKYALMTGPLFAGIRWQEMFAWYKSGVYELPPDDPAVPISNHALLLVGWDDTLEHGFGTGAWIVKNSWGDEWGMEGYAYVSFTSTFLDSGPRQFTYIRESASRLVLDEPQGGQTWITGTDQTVSWITDLAADRFEVGYLVGGQYTVVDDTVPGSSTHLDIEAPDIRAEDLTVRVTALAPDGAVLAAAESASPIYLVSQRVEWPTDGMVVQTGQGTQRPYALLDDGEGGCILFWRDSSGNYVTRLSSQGEPIWPAPRMVPSINGAMSAVGDGAGGAYLAFSVASGGNSRVHLVRVGPDGALPWGTMGRQVDHLGGEFSQGRSMAPLLAPDDHGGVVCVWDFYSGSYESVYGQRISADGVELWDVGDAPGLRLTLRPGAAPCALTRIDGDAFAVAYVGFGDGSFDRTDLWMQLVRDSGERPWGEDGRRVRSGVGPTSDHAVAPDLTGGAAVVWREAGVGWSQAQIQRFAVDGEAAWSEGGLTVERMDVAGQLHPLLVADETGGHLVAIAKETSLAEFEVSVHRIGPDGGRVWPADGVALERKIGMIGYPGVEAPLVADGTGGAIVFWAEFDAAINGGRVAITAQRVAADGTPDWTPYGEPIVLPHGVSAGSPAVCRDRAGHVSLAWGYQFPEPSVHFQRIAGTFPAPPRCEVTAWVRRDGELQPLTGAAINGCPRGDADAVVVVCDFVDADLPGVTVISPGEVGLDARGLGISLGSVAAADVAGTPDNGYCVTLTRDQVLGCSGCEGNGCEEGAVAGGPLLVIYRGVVVGVVPDVAVHGFDVNRDGEVNLAELVGLARTYGRELGDPDFDGCYDIDDDGLIDVADWNLLVEHYGETVGAATTTMVSLRRADATAGQVYEVVLRGDGVQAAALRLATLRAPASALEWNPGSPAASGAALLPAARDGDTETWLVLPRLEGAAGVETLLGRLILPETAEPADAPDGLRAVGGELMLAGGQVLALSGETTGVVARGASELGVPYPNPCNPTTTITFTAPRAGELALRIFDVTGRLVRTLIDEPVDGSNVPRRITWAGRDEADRPVASGVYFVRLTIAEEVVTRRLVLIR